MQTGWELERLTSIFYGLDPATVLEIGVMYGGTLWHWLQDNRYVVAVDDQMRHPNDWVRWADEAGSDLTLVQGRSQDPEVVDRVRELGPYEFLFIDADHTYEAVKRDWDTYRPMVEPGGVIAFHDFQPRPGPFGVDMLWGQIKTVTGARTVEISQRSDPPGEHGVALVWV